MVDSGNQTSFFSKSLDNINSILSINNEFEMSQKISANIPKIFQIFYSFKTKLYSNYVNENDIDQIIEALKFVDNLNLFMEESDVKKFKEKMGEITYILKKRNYDFKDTIIDQIDYTKMTIINHRNDFYRNKYFNDHKGLSEEIEKELDQVNKGNPFDFRLFKQMQNIYWVVKNVIDDKKKAELDIRFNNMKIICRKIKEKRPNNYSKYQSYDDYGNDYTDYKNYSGTYDYNDNYKRNEDIGYYKNSRYDDFGNKNHYYRGGYRKNNYNNNINNSNRKYYPKKQQEEKEVEIPADPSYYINKNKEEDLKEETNDIIYNDTNNSNLTTNDNTSINNNNNSNINGGGDLNNNIDNNNMSNNNNNNNFNGGIREEPNPSLEYQINNENKENNGGNGENSNINNNNDMNKNNDIEIITGNNNLTQNNIGNYKRKSKNYYPNKMIAVEVPPPSGSLEPTQDNNNNNNNNNILNDNQKQNDNNLNNVEDNINNGANIDNNNKDLNNNRINNDEHNGDDNFNYNSEIKQYNNNNYNNNNYNKYKNNYSGYKQNIYNKNNNYNNYNNYYNRYSNQNNINMNNNQRKNNFQIKKRDFVEIEDNTNRIISNNTIENTITNTNTNENEIVNGQENENINVNNININENETSNNINNNINNNDNILSEPNGEVLDGQQNTNNVNNVNMDIHENVNEKKNDDEKKINHEDITKAIINTEIKQDENKNENENTQNKNIEIPEKKDDIIINSDNEINGEDKNINTNTNTNTNINNTNDNINKNIININDMIDTIPQNDVIDGNTISNQNQNEEEKIKDEIKENINENTNDNNNNNNHQEIGEEENMSNEHINEEDDDDEDLNKYKGAFNAFVIEALGQEPKGDYRIKDHSSEDKEEEDEKIDNNNLGENDLYDAIQYDMENEELMEMGEEERLNEIEIRLKIKKLLKELNIPKILKDAEDELEQEELEKEKDIINNNTKDTNNINTKDNNEDIKENINSNDNNSGHNHGNKYMETIKDMDPKLKDKITDQILNSFKKQQILAPKFSYYTNNFFKQNPQMFSQNLLTLIQTYKKNSSLNMTTPLINYLFSQYNIMTPTKENMILQEYLLLKILEIDIPQIIWNNMQSFEKRILIPLYQKINFVKLKRYNTLENIFLQYVSGIYKIFQNSDEIIEKIQKYGSFHNTFMVDIGDTDIDICIVPKCTLSTFQNNYLEKLKKGISKLNLGIINKEIINNNYILLKVIYSSPNQKMNINVDITVHNMLPIFNSYLIRLYGLFDQRFHIMGIYLKYWAKNNKIHGAQDGFLSSYALLIMIIHFLQKVVEPKVLPNLQKIPKNYDLDKPIYGEEIYEYYYNDKKITINAYFEKDVEKIKENLLKINNGKVNEETVTNLLVKFFEYYAYIFESKQKISVHKDLIESIKEKDDNIAFSIDDPFEITHNPGKSMIKGSDNYKKFIKAMKKEVNLILSGEYVKRLEREKMLKISGTNNKNMS